jgi:hypothetical protein
MTLLEILELAQNAEPGSEPVATEEQLRELGFDGDLADFAYHLMNVQDWKGSHSYEAALKMIETERVVEFPLSKWVIFDEIFVHRVKMVKCAGSNYICERGFSHSRNECYTYEEAIEIAKKRIDSRIKALEELKCSYVTN